MRGYCVQVSGVKEWVSQEFGVGSPVPLEAEPSPDSRGRHPVAETTQAGCRLDSIPKRD